MFIGALLGLAVGWLINLLADALSKDVWVWPPHCQQCQTPRAGLQASGLLAYLTNHSRCKQCGKPIGPRWPLVELISAALFAFIFSELTFSSPPLLFIAAAYTTVLLLICVTDFEHRLIFDWVTFPASAAAIVLSLITPGLTIQQALIGGLIGLALTGAIYLGGKLFVVWQVRRGRKITEVAFGQGDVKLMVFIGLITGFGVIQALALGIVIGGVVAFGIIFYGLIRRESMLYVPYAYGPYLAVAGWIVMMQNAILVHGKIL
jgi:leader peptidase (prepilin peptidase) / N-methyltransferase